MNGTSYIVKDPEGWKQAIRDHLKNNEMSRYAFIRLCSTDGIFSIHTGECLLADSGKVTAQRSPNLGLAIQMARKAGFDVVLVPRRAPNT
jgi:hypothetical protein